MTSRTSIILIVILVIALGYFVWSRNKETKQNQTRNDKSTSIGKDNHGEDINPKALSSAFEALEIMENRIDESQEPIEFRFSKSESFTHTLKEKNTYGLYQSDMYGNIRMKTVWDDINGKEIKVINVIKNGDEYYAVSDDTTESVTALPDGIMTPSVLFKYIKKTVEVDNPLSFTKESPAYLNKNNDVVLADNKEHSKKDSMTELGINIYRTIWENDSKKCELLVYVNKETNLIVFGRFFYSVEDLDTDYVIEFKIKSLQKDFTLNDFK